MAGEIMSSTVLIMLTTRMKKADLRRSCKTEKKREIIKVENIFQFFTFHHLSFLINKRFQPCSFFTNVNS
jgi:hypothetical protein